MFKIILLIALAVVGASAQIQPAPLEAAPEPYSYGYETDTHAAQEEKDPAGRVTGFYTLADADGRQRRVDYVADELGFRAKVQTNEVGTRTGNSADVEVLASQPNIEQYTYQQPIRTAAVTAAPRAAPIRSTVGYGAGYPGYGYGAGYGATYGAGYERNYGYLAPPVAGATYAPPVAAAAYVPPVAAATYAPSLATGSYSSYNNHLPSQYYRSAAATVAPAGYAAGTGAGYYGGRYAAAPAAIPAAIPAARGYGSYQSIGAPGSAGYRSGIAPPAATGNLQGSSNYIVLKKK